MCKTRWALGGSKCNQNFITNLFVPLSALVFLELFVFWVLLVSSLPARQLLIESLSFPTERNFQVEIRVNYGRTCTKLRKAPNGTQIIQIVFR